MVNTCEYAKFVHWNIEARHEHQCDMKRLFIDNMVLRDYETC